MDQAITLLEHYKYAILLPLAVIEGPIITIIGSFLASMGFLNVYIVYAIAVLGNLIGDTIYYSIGRIGGHRLISRYGHRWGITEDRIKYAETHYREHLGKTLLFGKITEAPIIMILIMAGVTKVDFRKFLAMASLIEAPKMLVLAFVGFYFGKYYILIKEYLDASIATIFIILIVIILIYWFLIRKK